MRTTAEMIKAGGRPHPTPPYKEMNNINRNTSLILERIDGIKADISASRASQKKHFQCLAGLIVASVLTTILAIAGFSYAYRPVEHPVTDLGVIA